jgi:hypothetical protein
VSARGVARVTVTYHGDDFGLDGLVQGDEAEVGDEVELRMLELGLLIFTLFCGGRAVLDVRRRRGGGRRRFAERVSLWRRLAR